MEERTVEPESQTRGQEAGKRPFVRPKLTFVKPKLTCHGEFTQVTGFFGTFNP